MSEHIPSPTATTTAVPGPPPTSPGDGLGPAATVGLFLAIFMITIGVASILFPKKTPRKWG